MRRRQVVAWLYASAWLPSLVRAQSGERVRRIGFIGGARAPGDGQPPASFRRALKDLGYIEGRNVVYISQWADMQLERLPGVVRDVIAQSPDVIVANGYPAAEAARQASATIPIVVAFAGDPVATGLVASLARPGANVTGVSEQSAELSAKRVELLKQVKPTTGRIAVLWNARNAAMTARYREIERAAGSLHIAVQPVAVRDPADFDAAFAAITRERPDALLVVTDALTRENQRRVLDYAAGSDVPTMYEYSYLVRDGGLMSYGPNADDLYAQVATYVDRILKGAKPSDLPIWQPTQFELVLNLKAAKSIGMTVPQSVFVLANEVIQ